MNLVGMGDRIGVFAQVTCMGCLCPRLCLRNAEDLYPQLRVGVLFEENYDRQAQQMAG